MSPKTKKNLGVIGFIVAVCAVAYFMFGMPGMEMKGHADDFCACQTIECQQEVGAKIQAAVQEHAGTKRSASTVKMWNEAQQRIMECSQKELGAK
jgi:hypothetical protein